MNRTSLPAIVLTMLFAFAPCLYSQPFWQPMNGPCGGTTRGIAIDAQNAVFTATANGVFRSTDGGDHWSACFPSLPERNIMTVAVLPGDFFIVVTAGGDLYRSADGGNSWNLSASFGGLSGVSDIVSYNGAHYMAVDASVTSVDGVYRSMDGGASWTAVNSGLIIATPISLGIDKNNGYVYANISGKGVFRTTDQGNAWTQMNSGITIAQKFGYAITVNSGGTVFAGFSSWSQGSPVVAYPGAIFKSTNQGTSWTQSNNGFTDPDIHYLAASPHGELFAVNGQEKGTLYKSVDNGSNWTETGMKNVSAFISCAAQPPSVFISSNNGVLRSKNNGVGWTFVNDGIVNTNIGVITQGPGSSLLAGDLGNGVFVSTDAGGSWADHSSGIGVPEILSLAKSAKGSLFAGTYMDGVYKSTDAGATWSKKDLGMDALYMYGLAVSDSDHVFCGGWFIRKIGTKAKFYYAIMRSSDDGENWALATDTATGQISANSIAVGNNNNLFVATQNGTVHRSLDHGWTWEQLNFPFQGAYSMKVYCDRAENMVYVGSAKGLYRSNDKGITWAQIDTIFTAVNAWSIDKACNVILAGTDERGVRMSTDNGGTWRTVKDGLDGKGVQALWIAPDGYCFAGTTGGVYRSIAPVTTAPLPPALVTPPDSAQVSLSTVLQWNPACGATSYQVQVSNMQDFSAIVFDSSGIISSGCTTPSLNGLTTYYWRVRSKGQGGTGSWSTVRQFSTSSSIEHGLILEEPLNKATGIPRNTTFRWRGESSQDGFFAMQIATDSLFTPPLVYEVYTLTGCSHSVLGLPAMKVLYWRVRWQNKSDTTLWSSVWSFTTTDDGLFPPTMVAPKDSDMQITLPVVFSWRRVINAEHYRLDISGLETFGGDLNKIIWGIVDTSITVSDLKPGEKYFWRVYAYNSIYRSPYSGIRSFEIPVDTMAAPVLVAPKNNAVWVQSKTWLLWSNTAFSTGFRAQLSTSPDFSALVYDTTMGLFMQLDLTSLLPYTRYYWRVRSIVNKALGPWSEVWSFTTKLAAPMLLSPIDGAQNVSIDTTLTWSPAVGADSYRLQLANDLSFTTLIRDSSGVGPAFLLVNNLAPNTLYYWHVNGTCTDGTSMWSDTWSFTTEQTTGIDDTRSLTGFHLSQNHPNPFNSSTTIEFSLPKSEYVTLEVFDVLGRKVATLVDGVQAAGMHQTAWDGKGILAGLYFCRMTTGTDNAIRTMIVSDGK